MTIGEPGAQRQARPGAGTIDTEEPPPPRLPSHGCEDEDDDDDEMAEKMRRYPQDFALDRPSSRTFGFSWCVRACA